jgi:hypothetical protein
MLDEVERGTADDRRWTAEEGKRGTEDGRRGADDRRQTIDDHGISFLLAVSGLPSPGFPQEKDLRDGPGRRPPSNIGRPIEISARVG